MIYECVQRMTEEHKREVSRLQLMIHSERCVDNGVRVHTEFVSVDDQWYDLPE
jgi:hypothetical protein